MYQDHPFCKTPNNKQIKIWRYIDITKLISLFEEQALYFPNITKLDEDPLEGFLNRATVKMIRKVAKSVPEGKQTLAKLIVEDNLKKFRNVRYHLFVSSWHINTQESAGMWKLYSKDGGGIAIQSTFERFKNSFTKTIQEVFIGEITYIDEDTDQIDWTNSINYVLHKRKSFEHEKELRAVVLENKKPGTFIPINIETLIEKIYVAPNCPEWHYKLVKQIVKRYGFQSQIDIQKSKLFEDPIY